MGSPQESRLGNRNVERFKFRKEPPVKGLTPDILADLYDIGTKWGKVDPSTEKVTYRSGDIELGFELYIVIAIGMKHDSFMVSKGLMGLSTEGRPIQNGMVQWDMSISAKEAKDAISRIDEKAQAKGLIDQKGTRAPLKPESSLLTQGELPRHVVEITFHEKGAMEIVPEYEDPQEALKRFDQPDILTIVKHPLFGSVICRNEDADNILLHGDIEKIVLEEKGININDPRWLRDMSKKEMEIIRQEMDQRLKMLKTFK